MLLKQLEDTQRENYQVGCCGRARGAVCDKPIMGSLGFVLNVLALQQVTEHLRRELLAKTEAIAALESDLVKVRDLGGTQFTAN